MDSTATTSQVAGLRVTPASSVGAKAAHGAFWTVCFSVLNKFFTLGSQVALAWFLLPQDFGLVAMALSITSVVTMLCGSSLSKVLIQRQERFDEDAGQVFWLSLAMNAAAALLLAAISPLAGMLFKEPRVISLILIAAAAIPLMALPTIYAAALYRDLRFKTVSMLHCGEGIIRNGSAVALAACGFGAYSLVLPLLASALFAAILFRAKAGRIAIGEPQPRQWKALLAPAGWLMLHALFAAIQGYGAAFIIGIGHDSTVAGLYYWGFALSTQAMFLLANNLQTVFFPVLSKVNDDVQRQYAAFRKTSQALLLIAVPVCALQVLLARPFIEMVFHARWLPAAPVVQWLSLGMITQPLSVLAASLLLARGRFGALAALTGFSALTTLISASAGALAGHEVAIAQWTCGGLFISGLIAGWVALRQFEKGWRELAAIIAGPLLITPICLLAGWLITVALRGWDRWAVVTMTTFLLLALYFLLAKWVLPGTTAELISRLNLGRWLGAPAPLQRTSA